MIKSYLKIALRNIRRHFVFSFINITGLAMGMSACFLIFLYVSFEFSYDTYHAHADRIYRVVTDVKTATELHSFGTAAPAGPAIRQEFPEVQSMVRTNFTHFLIKRGDVQFQEDNVLFADTSLFTVFSFPLVRGDASKALTAPFSVVLSETAVKKYFGDSDPMGQPLLLDDKFQAFVTGVMKDIPANSHFRTDIVVSLTSVSQKLFPGMDHEWNSFGFNTYLLLAPGADPKRLEKQFPALMEKYAGQVMREANVHFTLSLEPLTRIYMYSKRFSAESGNAANVYVFSLVAVFILLIACFNFINLTTARSSDRAKEVGIRKVSGAGRREVAMQFLGESILISIAAFLLAMLLSLLFLPIFNQLSGKVIASSIFERPGYIGLLFLIACGVGLLAGIYPALVLSGFQVIAVLKGNYSSGNRGIVLRKTLVILQFVISIALIACTLVVHSQLRYMREQPLGFKKDHVLAIKFNNHDDRIRDHYESFKTAFLGIPDVTAVSASSSLPSTGQSNQLFQVENRNGDLQTAGMDVYYVDYDFLPEYGIQMAAGRAFSRSFMTDTSRAIIINESAAHRFGYDHPGDALSKRYTMNDQTGRIIGVVHNFHYRSLQSEITPLAFVVSPRDFRYFSLTIRDNSIPATLGAIEARWKQLAPSSAFASFFVDEAFDRQYKAEDRFGRLFLYFAVFAIFISSLGLLGLAAYSTLQRTKEICVRKVLGASVSGIVALLLTDFLRLVLVAFIIASPIAWFGMSRWLGDFAYRVDLSWWIFLLAGLLAMFTALITISFQTVSAALTDPAKGLRME